MLPKRLTKNFIKRTALVKLLLCVNHQSNACASNALLYVPDFFQTSERLGYRRDHLRGGVYFSKSTSFSRAKGMLLSSQRQVRKFFKSLPERTSAAQKTLPLNGAFRSTSLKAFSQTFAWPFKHSNQSQAFFKSLKFIAAIVYINFPVRAAAQNGLGLMRGIRQPQSPMHCAVESESSSLTAQEISDAKEVICENENDKGETPLMRVLARKESALSIQLIHDSSLESLNLKDVNGKCALDYALEHNMRDAVQALLNRNVESTPLLRCDSHTLIMRFVTAGNESAALKLITHASLAELNTRDKRGYSVLYYAIENRCNEAARVLIARGISVIDGLGALRTPLILALQVADEARSLELIDRLDDQALARESYNGYSALWHAISRKLNKATEVLIARKVSLTSGFGYSETALMYALDLKDDALALRLIGDLSNEELKTEIRAEENALHVAVENDCWQSIEALLARNIGLESTRFGPNKNSFLVRLFEKKEDMRALPLIADLSDEALKVAASLGDSLFHCAVENECWQSANALRARNIGLEAARFRVAGDTFLIRLLKTKEDAQASQLIADVSDEELKTETSGGKNIFYFAVENECWQSVEALLARNIGLEFTRFGSNEASFLIQLFKKKEDTRALRFIVDLSDEALKMETKLGESAFHYAVQNKCWQSADALRARNIGSAATCFGMVGESFLIRLLKSKEDERALGLMAELSDEELKDEVTGVENVCHCAVENECWQSAAALCARNPGVVFARFRWKRKTFLMQQLSTKNDACASRLISMTPVKALNLQDCYGNSALHYAVRQGTPESLALLLLKNVDPTLVNSKHKTALHCALDAHQDAIATQLIHYSSLQELINIDGETFSLFASIGHADCAEAFHALIQKKWDFAQENGERATRLIVAIEAGTDQNWLLKLTELCSNETLEVQPHLGNSALQLAAKKGLSLLVERLLERNVNSQQSNVWRQTPLMLAYEGNHWSCVAQIIKAQQRLGIHSDFAQKILFENVRCGNLLLFKALAENGCPLSYQDEQGCSVLHIAVQMGACDMVPYLLRSDPAVWILKTNEGYSCLHELIALAKRPNSERTVQKLVEIFHCEATALLNAPELASDGRAISFSKLQHTIIVGTKASLFGSQSKPTSIVELGREALLARRELELKAFVNQTDRQGLTVLDHAVKENQFALCNALVRRLGAELSPKNIQAQSKLQKMLACDRG